MKRTLCFLALNCYLGFCFHLNQTFAQMPGPPIIDTPLTTSKTYFYNGEIIVPYSNGHVSVTNNATVNILSTTEVTLLPGFTASVDSGCEEFVARIQECPVIKDSSIVFNVTCFGSTNGSIQLFILDDTLQNYFEWSPKRGRASSIDNLDSGIYYVRITKQSGCFKLDTFTVLEPPKINLRVTTTESTCHDSIGTANIEAIGGRGPLSYYWKNLGNQTSSIINLSAGIYEVIVTDSVGCYSKTNALISDQDGPSVTSQIISPVTCHGGSDARISVTLPNGAPEPVYPCGGLPDRLSAGNFPVIQSDANGCITVVDFEILDPPLIEIQITTTHATCGNSNGNAFVNATGGIGLLNYRWQNGSSGRDLMNVSSGIDTIFITDENGCTVSSPVFIDDLDGPVLNSIINNVTCPENMDGSISLVTSNDPDSYSFLWDNNISESNSIFGIGIGQYHTVVIDSNGCKRSIQNTVSVPEKLDVRSFVHRPTADSIYDGMIELIVLGGSPPFTYQWSNNATSKDIDNLSLGQYDVRVVDANGCQLINNFKVFPISPFTLNSCGENSPLDIQSITALQQACSTCDPVHHWPNLDLVRDFGANGTDANSDEISFEWANDFINSQTNGVQASLTIPYGTYHVGRQTLGSSIPQPSTTIPWYMAGHDVLCFENKDNLSIVGVENGSSLLPKIIFEPCMLYGSFDPATGNRLLPCPTDPSFVRVRYAATPGSFISLINCSNFNISNLDVSGNSDALSVGGMWSQDIQIGHDGLYLYACHDMIFENLSIHNFGRDGMCIKDLTTGVLIQPINFLLKNCNFIFNCRTGLAWTNGSNLIADHCNFSYNGFGPWGGSSTRDGLDLEEEQPGPQLSTGKFFNCTFNINSSVGVESNYNSEDYFFENCKFVASTLGFAIKPSAKRMTFKCCEIYGLSTNAYDDYLDPQNPIVDDNNVKFIGSNFHEEYFDNDSNKYFSMTSHFYTAPSCSTNVNHSWLIDFYQQSGVLFDGCSISTNFHLKWAELIGKTPTNINGIKIKNTAFYNYGMDDANPINYRLGTFEAVDFSLGGNSTFTPPQVNQANCFCTGVGPGHCWNVLACINNIGELPIARATQSGSVWCDIPNCSPAFNSLWPTAYVNSMTCQDRYDDSRFRSNYWHIHSGTCTSPNYTLASPECIYCGQPPCGANFDRHSNVEIQTIDYIIEPNPASNNLIIKYLEVGDQIQLITMTGKIIGNYNILGSELKITIEGLPTGVYFVRSLRKGSKIFVKF